MTAAAVVVVLVCERVFEFVSVCGERVRPAGLGSRDSAHREPLTATRRPHTNSNSGSHTTTRHDLDISFPLPAQILHRFQRLALSTAPQVKLACELPNEKRRSLSTWTCAELARTLRRDGVVDDISPQSVQRMLESV